MSASTLAFKFVMLVHKNKIPPAVESELLNMLQECANFNEYEQSRMEGFILDIRREFSEPKN